MKTKVNCKTSTVVGPGLFYSLHWCARLPLVEQPASENAAIPWETHRTNVSLILYFMLQKWVDAAGDSCSFTLAASCPCDIPS